MDLEGLDDDPDFWNMTIDSGSPMKMKPEPREVESEHYLLFSLDRKLIVRLRDRDSRKADIYIFEASSGNSWATVSSRRSLRLQSHMQRQDKMSAPMVCSYCPSTSIF